MIELDLTSGSNKLAAIFRDLKRAFSNHKIEQDGPNLIVANSGLTIGGVFDSSVKRHEAVQRAIDEGDPEKESWMREWVLKHQYMIPDTDWFQMQFGHDHNLIPDAGINFILNLVYGTAVTQSWYQGLFTNNVTPASDWTSAWAGASSGPDATELDDVSGTGNKYTATGRQAATFGAAATKSIATSSPTAFTLATGTSALSIYGSTLNSIATVKYNATDKYLAAATLFGTAKTGLGAADVINVNYTITGSST